MNISRVINAVDSHTAGEPTRIITGGIPTIPGASMPEKKAYLSEHMDWLRTSLMHEPRGHDDMFGSILTAPTNPKADFGIIFMDGGGYLNMCGHGSIGAASVAVETGIVPAQEPMTRICMEAPAGLIQAEVEVEHGHAKSVTITNVPSFLYQRNATLLVPEMGEVTFDIAFGGSFFAIVQDRYFGCSICSENKKELMRKALLLREVINREIKVAHPTLPHIKTVDLVEIYGAATSEAATYRNVVIFGEGQVDRSPCGTGTSAKMATLYAKGQLAVGEDFVYESIIGTTFKGRIEETATVGPFDAVIPKIQGSAWITGFHQFVMDETDPVKYGFSLR
ncbi:Proline racemase [Clostridiaceae bacterium JG1575]|nr:Proline racemase [Clostridiaceae bacterium JG1575]